MSGDAAAVKISEPSIAAASGIDPLISMPILKSKPPLNLKHHVIPLILRFRFEALPIYQKEDAEVAKMR